MTAAPRKALLSRLSAAYYLRNYSVTGLCYSLKLAIYDGLTWTNPSPPHQAFVRSVRGPSSPAASRLLAETPGFALFFGPAYASINQVLTGIMDEGKLVVGFNRAPNQQDVVVTLDLYVEDTQMVEDRIVRRRSPQMVEDFSVCVDELLSLQTKK